ncbi:F-box/RNI-like superfamily protein [Rhynchospora pubera]|uniref:F-box/RNI-like superfamily protein n=1 Tax=Rhynchospora pubera TaxID=906938 RepID=A0AAV8BYM2_9POAL|nr:F-box/RNI-like superfamily protein [Rhynchospora pubera]
MLPFEALNFLKDKRNSSNVLVILAMVPAVSFLLHKQVKFRPYFPIRKNNATKQDTFGNDTIGNLPECIKHKILVYLPIKEAVRTSILSKSWRHTWSTIPDLVIDNSIKSNSHQNKGNLEESRNEKFVNQLVSCHKGNLHKFKLSGKKLCGFLPSRWMQTLSQKQISELILEAEIEERLHIGGNGFSCCLKLKVLVLSRCVFILPSEFDGFRLLHTLDIRDCIAIKMDISTLVSLCPLLEKLTLKPTFDQVIKINAPNLRELTIYGKFYLVSLLTPNLCIAKFVTLQSVTKATSRTVGIQGNLIKQPVYIYGIKSSKPENGILSCSTFCYFLWDYPPTLQYLITMVVILEPSEYYIAHKLLGGVSFLQKLVLYLEPVDPSSVSKVNKVQDKIFPRLREATIIPFSSSEIVFEFTESILRNAPILENLTVKGEMKDSEIFKLNEIPKLSAKAEIIFCKSYFCADGKFQCCCCPQCDIVVW